MNLGKHYSFTPPLWATLATLFVCLLFLQLAHWQYHRFHEKLNLQVSFQDREHSAPLQLGTLKRALTNSPNIRPFLYYPINVTGQFDRQIQFLLDNQVVEGRLGYDVLSLFHARDDQGDVVNILVNRGFIAANPDRRILPVIPNVAGTVTLQGRLALPPQRIFALGDTIDQPRQWPQRIEAIDLKHLQTLLPGQTLAPFYILLNPQTPYGFVRQWHGVATDPYRSLGYAWQWLGFAMTLLIIYGVLNLKKREH